MKNFIDIENSHASGFTQKRPIGIVKGKGVHVWDESGKQYIDCMTGIGVASLGHANEEFNAAITAQMNELVTCHELFPSPVRAEYMEALSEFLPGDDFTRFFLCSTGTEAVEAAIKVARIATQRSKIISLKKGYHGRSLGSLQPTWDPKYKKFPGGSLGTTDYVGINDLEGFKEIASEDHACFILELVQGEGGINMCEHGFFKGVHEICQQKGILLIVDEIQSGFGKTGARFAVEHYDGIMPDIITISKAMGGGIPLAAACYNQKIYESLPSGLHSSTFGGNPLSCRAGLTVIEMFNKYKYEENARQMGELLLAGIAAIDSKLIREVRGIGLMIGIDLRRKAGPYIKALLDQGIIVAAAGKTTIRLLPPLTLEKGHVDSIINSLAVVLQD